MKKSDYKDHLDKIKCNPEFRMKIEEMLSSERDGEYADSVSDVERVTKINYYRWTAIAASAVLVLGIGGTAIYLTKNTSAPSESMLSDNPNDEIQPFSETAVLESYNMNVTMFNNDSDGLDIGNIPAEASNQIIANLKRCSWQTADSEKFNDFDSETRLSITCTGEEEFVYTVNSNGYALLEHNGEQTFYYNESCYFNIVRVIAQYLPYCSWTSMLGGKTGEKLDVIFNEHISEIELTRSEVDSFDSWIMLMYKEPYAVYIDQYGKITVSYNSEYGESSSGSISFNSSPAMYMQIVKELGEELGIETATETETSYSAGELSANEYVYKITDENITAEPMQLHYVIGSGQFDGSYTLNNVDMSAVSKALKSHNWKVSEKSFPENSFYVVKNLLISSEGEVYDSQTSKMYAPADDDFSDLTIAVNDLKSCDDFAYVMSLLASSGKYDTISCNDLSFYYSNTAISANGESNIQYVYRGGTGKFYHSPSGEEYFMINSPDGSYSVEYFEQHRDWTTIENGEQIAEYADFTLNTENIPQKITSGFSGMDSCLIDYDYLCTYALSLINEIYERSENTYSTDLRIDETTGCIQFSVETTLYETDNIYISLNISNGNLVKAFVELTDYNTGATIGLYDFQLGDGIGSGITYEYADIYSEISDNMKLEITKTE